MLSMPVIFLHYDQIYFFQSYINVVFIIEPRRKKIGLLCFRPGLTRAGVCSYRRWLEANKFPFRKKRNCTIRVAKTNALIGCAVTAHLICAFVFVLAKFWFSHGAAQLSSYSLVPGSAPTNIRATSYSSQSISLTWGPPIIANGAIQVH